MTDGSSDVLVVGESLMDVVLSGASVQETPGGSPFNVARGLAALGRDVTLLTSIGRDARGHRLRDALDASGVRHLATNSTGIPTSTATATLQREGSADYEFDITWDLSAAPDIVPECDIMHTGSLAVALAPGSGHVHELVLERRDRAIISMDPNIRPHIVGRLPGARSAIADMLALADVVKLSDEDARWLFPDAATDRVIGDLLAGGVLLVAITRGALGSTLATASARVTVDAVPSSVVDTIGAGDSYAAALLDRLLLRGHTTGLDRGTISGLESSTLAEIASYASACAAITVARRGAYSPDPGEIRERLGEYRPRSGI